MSRTQMPQEKNDFETEEIVDLAEVSVEKCRVCAGVPASKNYGSITCASCKNFFLRVTTAGVEVGECKNLHLCSQQNFRGAGKAKCTPCRYEKCIEAGMIPEITARRMGCKLREKRAQVGLKPRGRTRLRLYLDDEDELQLVPSTSLYKQNFQPLRKRKFLSSTDFEGSTSVKEFQLATKVSSKPFLIDSSTNAIRDLVNLQMLIINDDPTNSVILDFSYFTDRTLNDALNNPATVCSRVPIGYNRTADLQIPQHLLPTMNARSFTRSLVLFADWCRGVKEFWELEENDRINLFAKRLLCQCFFNNYYYTYKTGYNDGLLMTMGMKLRFENLPMFEGITKIYSFLMDYGVNKIIPIIRKIQMRDEEFVLMKNIVIFSASVGLKEKSGDVMKKAHNKYSNLLIEHLKSRFKDESLAIEYFVALMEIPKHLQILHQKMIPEYNRMVMVQDQGIGGILPLDFFRRL